MHFLINHWWIWWIWHKNSSYCCFGRYKCHQKNDYTKNGSSRMIKLSMKKYKVNMYNMQKYNM